VKKQTNQGRLFLFHWHEAEATARADDLRKHGWHVEIEAEDGARGGKAVLANPPDAVVVSLDRLPSHGRETAQGLRGHKAGRTIPIVFVGGEGEAVAKTKAKVPDALFTTAEELPRLLAAFKAK
jgi:response regulator RpfG family c-di-GMP phosphodiesterase